VERGACRMLRNKARYATQKVRKDDRMAFGWESVTINYCIVFGETEDAGKRVS
jgi:hypothetical protein